MLQLVTCHAETWHISACLSCDPCLCRTVINRAKINRAKINRGTWPTKHLSFLMSKPPLPEMVWRTWSTLVHVLLVCKLHLGCSCQSVCWRNHIILDKPVHSFHDVTAHLRSSGYWNEARARKCNDLCEPANNSSRHQASFWNAVFHCITRNCKQTWRFCGDAWSHSRRDTMRFASCMLASGVNLHSPSAQAATRMRFVAAQSVFITLFTIAWNSVIWTVSRTLLIWMLLIISTNLGIYSKSFRSSTRARDKVCFRSTICAPQCQ